MEDLAVNEQFWRGKRVLITGHTGFKGSWLALWLQKLGAEVAGYALPAATESLFEIASVGATMVSAYDDIRHYEHLHAFVDRFQPEIVFHLAAQALVRESYAEPVGTYQVNVIGTVHLLEAVRRNRSCRVVVNVTSDKCYDNDERVQAYRETDNMGGHDPYSSSKGCAELVTAAYRSSFFQAPGARQIAVASGRAGNVIGGGDFSKDRIVPDFMASLRAGRSLCIRNPDAIRPWQHVLEPLSGYLLLAEKLWENPMEFAQGWNFGPAVDDIRPVRWIVERLSDYSTDHLGSPMAWQIDSLPKPHEAHMLMLDSTKSRIKLGWKPRWTLDQALRAVVEWHTAYNTGKPIHDIVMRQIDSYSGALPGASQVH